jgi:hypothetical protein
MELSKAQEAISEECELIKENLLRENNYLESFIISHVINLAQKETESFLLNSLIMYRIMRKGTIVACCTITTECDSIKGMLLDKNRKYGNSVFEPINIFSKANWLDIIHIRIDDKLKRIQNMQADDCEDTVLDLIGYLILKRVGCKIVRYEER